MRDIKEIRKALEDSKEYFKKTFPDMNPKAPLISFTDLARGIKALAVANEICTLKWVLGKGRLNCYPDASQSQDSKKEAPEG